MEVRALQGESGIIGIAESLQLGVVCRGHVLLQALAPGGAENCLEHIRTVGRSQRRDPLDDDRSCVDVAKLRRASPADERWYTRQVSLIESVSIAIILTYRCISDALEACVPGEVHIWKERA